MLLLLQLTSVLCYLPSAQSERAPGMLAQRGLTELCSLSWCRREAGESPQVWRTLEHRLARLHCLHGVGFFPRLYLALSEEWTMLHIFFLVYFIKIAYHRYSEDAFSCTMSLCGTWPGSAMIQLHCRTLCSYKEINFFCG